jgi:hypothetical protein
MATKPTQSCPPGKTLVPLGGGKYYCMQNATVYNVTPKPTPIAKPMTGGFLDERRYEMQNFLAIATQRANAAEERYLSRLTQAQKNEYIKKRRAIEYAAGQATGGPSFITSGEVSYGVDPKVLDAQANPVVRSILDEVNGILMEYNARMKGAEQEAYQINYKYASDTYSSAPKPFSTAPSIQGFRTSAAAEGDAQTCQVNYYIYLERATRGYFLDSAGQKLGIITRYGEQEMLSAYAMLKAVGDYLREAFMLKMAEMGRTLISDAMIEDIKASFQSTDIQAQQKALDAIDAMEPKLNLQALLKYAYEEMPKAGEAKTDVPAQVPIQAPQEVVKTGKTPTKAEAQQIVQKAKEEVSKEVTNIVQNAPKGTRIGDALNAIKAKYDELRRMDTSEMGYLEKKEIEGKIDAFYGVLTFAGGYRSEIKLADSIGTKIETALKGSESMPLYVSESGEFESDADSAKYTQLSDALKGSLKEVLAYLQSGSNKSVGVVQSVNADAVPSKVEVKTTPAPAGEKAPITFLSITVANVPKDIAGIINDIKIASTNPDAVQGTDGLASLIVSAIGNVNSVHSQVDSYQDMKRLGETLLAVRDFVRNGILEAKDLGIKDVGKYGTMTQEDILKGVQGLNMKYGSTMVYIGDQQGKAVMSLINSITEKIARMAIRDENGRIKSPSEYGMYEKGLYDLAYRGTSTAVYTVLGVKPPPPKLGAGTTDIATGGTPLRGLGVVQRKKIKRIRAKRMISPPADIFDRIIKLSDPRNLKAISDKVRAKAMSNQKIKQLAAKSKRVPARRLKGLGDIAVPTPERAAALAILAASPLNAGYTDFSQDRPQIALRVATTGANLAATGTPDALARLVCLCVNTDILFGDEKRICSDGTGIGMYGQALRDAVGRAISSDCKDKDATETVYQFWKSSSDTIEAAFRLSQNPMASAMESKQVAISIVGGVPSGLVALQVASRTAIVGGFGNATIDVASDVIRATVAAVFDLMQGQPESETWSAIKRCLGLGVNPATDFRLNQAAKAIALCADSRRRLNEMRGRVGAMFGTEARSILNAINAAHQRMGGTADISAMASNHVATMLTRAAAQAINGLRRSRKFTPPALLPNMRIQDVETLRPGTMQELGARSEHRMSEWGW